MTRLQIGVVAALLMAAPAWAGEGDTRDEVTCSFFARMATKDPKTAKEGKTEDIPLKRADNGQDPALVLEVGVDTKTRVTRMAAAGSYRLPDGDRTLEVNLSLVDGMVGIAPSLFKGQALEATMSEAQMKLEDLRFSIWDQSFKAPASTGIPKLVAVCRVRKVKSSAPADQPRANCEFN